MHTAHTEVEISRLTAFDLNLLVAFTTLAQERSVTRAAERAGVTQSAMSHTLARLRELLGDPLMVRQGAGMALTPRAQELWAPIHSALLSLGRALEEPRGFSAVESNRHFRLATPDLFEYLFLPALQPRIAAEAPRVGLTIQSTATSELKQQLESGATDMAVVAHFDGQESSLPALDPSGLSRLVLFHDHFSCFVRKNHACAKRRSGSRLPFGEYLGLPHIQVAPFGKSGGLVDEALAARGKQRSVLLRVPQFAAAIRAVKMTDMILTAPSMIASLGNESLAQFAPPLSLPGHRVELVWHDRMTQDPGHRWLRNLLVSFSKSVSPAPRSRT